MKSLRVAMIGQRGVPATFGGVEHHVEELGSGLAARNHDITVFCRTNYGGTDRTRYRGMHLRHLPTLGTKHLDAVTHSALSSLIALGANFDIVHYHALGPGLFAPLPRFFSGARVVQTIHGLDDQRAKWGHGARLMLSTARWVSCRVPDATVVVSNDLARAYQRWGRTAIYIPNGVRPSVARPVDQIGSRFGLAAGSYALFVGRLVPEKAPDMLLRAFKQLSSEMRLVIAGGSNFTDSYASSLRELAADDPRVMLIGYVYGTVLEELYTNAAAFVLPSILEGLPLALLEAASYGAPLVASAIPPHLEIMQQEGPGRRLFAPGDERGLSRVLGQVLADTEGERNGAALLQARILERYCWDDVVRQTEGLYEGVLASAG
jgi:glycosyltransferase involved in cell wall biosynthesis